MTTQPERNVYCYVDETGQDTPGRLFVVSVVVVNVEREALAARLEEIERQSGKGKVKWIHSRHPARLAYIQSVLASTVCTGILYFSAYRRNRSYMALTALSTAKAIILASAQSAGTTVYVDGLPKARFRWFGVELRRLGVRTRKVGGVRREDSDAMIRLADACCGFVRLALSGASREVMELFEQAKKSGNLREA